MSSPAAQPVGETSTLISLPNGIASVLVLNSSGGMRDAVGAPDVIVNVGAAASASPQVGMLLQPGQLFEFPLLSQTNGAQQLLYAVATGPNAQIEVTLSQGWGDE